MNFSFQTPKHVMHVFHNMHTYGKPQNTPEYRQHYLDWPNELVFSAGHIEQDTVVLNDSIEAHSGDFEQSRMLIMTDYKPSSSYQPICDSFYRSTQWYSLVRDFQHPRDYSIFKLTRSDGIFRLYLNYKDNGSFIGIPRRDDFLLAELMPNKPVRVTINGKYDFSLTGRRDRTFHLLDYVFVYYGEFSQFEVQPWNRIAAPMPFSFEPEKHIDLQKILR